jgi:two-component system sensor kinase FixL
LSGVSDDLEGAYRRTLDSLLEGFQIIDREWRYVYVNPAAAVHGRSRPEDLIGRTMWEAYPGVQNSALFVQLQRCMQFRLRTSFEYQFQFPDGSMRWFELRVEPVPEGICIHSVDIQSRKDAEIASRDAEHDVRAGAERLRSIMEAVADGIIVIDAQGRIETFNPAAERLFGYEAHEVVGQNVSLLMPSPDRDRHDGYIRRYLETREAHVIGVGRQVTAQRRNGETFPIFLSIGEMSVRGETKFVGILHDLTERVRMEERLREQTALARLGEMAAVLAHEIKNPLAGVRGAVEVIGRRLPQGGSETAVVGDIISRIDGLNRLLTEILVFARPPKLRPAPLELPPLLERTVKLLKQDKAYESLAVELTGSAPPVMGDPDLLRSLFLNLLLNGAQATAGRGTIRASVGTADVMCSVEIADNGPGIPHDIRDRIFTPFFTTKSRGTGLGLATARRIAEAHRGRIRVHCPAEGGTTMIVELPLA